MVSSISKMALLLILGAILSPCDAFSYVVTLQPENEDCFVILIPRGKLSIIGGSFQVEDNDVSPKDFTATITELPKGNIVYEPKKEALAGHFLLKSDLRSTHYSLCFRNNARDDDDNSFDVGFNIRVGDLPRGRGEEEIGPETKRAYELVDRAVKIHEDWSVMLDHLDYAHNREAVYEDLASSILYRLAKWTYIEAFLVIGMATGQVMYWKKFFETKRYL
ncbi:unnamed protein product [Cylindrotheca closterium]|uniref:GOLD domain-containing protein n=1 Tax=Cylindrotheca closterium TaxID=2856 RepID=A0AAD2GAZ1_9STRA|nr:unnamed protein product [Cylindrotheca closterium]